MTLETVTLKLPRKLLSDAGSVASAQDVTIGHLVRNLLAKEINRRLNPKATNHADDGLIAALQVLLARDMAEAADWDDLEVRLQYHGYEFRPAGGGIVLFKRSCGTRVCKGSELGFPYRTLVQRFGHGMPGHPHGALGIEVVAQDAPRPLNSTVKGRLQRTLEPVFKTSTDWETLITRLDRRGFVLRPMGTGSAIYTHPGGQHVCNTATVGYRYRALVKKFGAPMPGHPHGADWVRGQDGLNAQANVAGQEQLSQEPLPLEMPEEPEFEVIDRDWRERAAQLDHKPDASAHVVRKRAVGET